VDITYHPKQEEAQQISTRDPRTLWEAVWYIIVTLSKYTPHEHRRDTASIVGLRRKINDCNHSSYDDIQTRSPDASSCADIHREAKKVLDSAATIEHNQNGENGGADDSSNHAVPPE